MFVEKQFDDNSIIKKPLLWPELNNIMDIVAKNTIYIEQLEELLKRYNLISDDNIREMKTIVEKEFVTQYRQFYVVEDAEEDFRY